VLLSLSVLSYPNIDGEERRFEIMPLRELRVGGRVALTQSAQILLVARRDPQDPVRRILKGAGYAVISVDSASSVIRTAERSHPALIVVESGALNTAVAESLASFADANRIPVIRDWSGPESLVAEVERVLGKPEPASRESSQILVGPLCVDFGGHTTSVAGVTLDLTAREFELLCHLARHPGWVYSRQELLEQVWGYEFGDPRVVTVHMANLRKKLDAASPGCEFIETVRNVGYKLVVPALEQQEASGAGPPLETPAAGVEETPVAPSAAPHPADERRLVTALSAHLGGLAALTESLDIESLRDVIDALFELLVPCVERYGGRVERRSPDGFVALFGAPVAHDNDAEMALRAAVDIRQAAERFEREKAVAGLSVHSGISTGVAIAGAVGPSANEYSAVGEPIDAASCLADLAGAGDVLVGPETLALVAGIVSADPAGIVRVRGRVAELQYHRINQVKRGSGLRGGGPRIESALVGREEPLALFRAALDRLDQGIGSVVFVSGEAGVGKSRLIAEIRREAAGRDLKWLEARTLSYGQNISYRPFREVVQADCGIDPSDSAAEKERKLRERAGKLFADKAGDFLPVLAGLLGIAGGQFGDFEPLRPEEEGVRKTVTDRTGRYARRLSTESPLVLVFEDVHWLDRSSAMLLQSLFPLAADVPVVICMVGRGGTDSLLLELFEAARGHEGLYCVDIQLSRLSQRQTQQLVRNLLGGSEVESQVMRAIENRSEGNPFFVEEIIRHLLDAGSLRRDEHGNWSAGGPGDGVVIPATVYGVIAARIDRLPDDARQELLRASVIGRSFYDGLLRSLSASSDEQFDRSLRSLQDHQLVVLKRQHPEVEYAFKHALVQEAAYGTLLLKQRKQLHRRIAKAIEELYSSRIADLYGVLAYHYTKAEDWKNAQTFLLRAGDQSVSMAADSEAVAYYQQAMAALLQAFDETSDSSALLDQVDWFVAATEPFWLARCLGDLLDSAHVFHQRVLETCGPADPRTAAATAILAGCHFQRGAYETCGALAKDTLQALEAAGREDDPSVTRLLLLLGLSCSNTDRFVEAEEIFSRALALEESKKSPSTGVLQDLYIFLGTSHSFTGRHQDMRRVIEEALGRFDLRGTQRGWMLLMNLCWVNIADGRWDDAAALAQECLEGIRSPYLRAFAARYLGEVRFAQRAYLEAEEHLTYAIALLEEFGEPPKRFEALANLAETQLQEGKVDKAEETALKLLRLMEATVPDCYEAPALWTLAGVKMARGDLTAADSLLSRSAEVVREKYAPRNPFCAELWFRRALLGALQGRDAEAEGNCQRAVGLMADIGGRDHPRIQQMAAEWEEKGGRGLAGRAARKTLDSESEVD
jgi:class 3 adenylate cyclase/tetratricopeptide (TPR) repeat protein